VRLAVLLAAVLVVGPAAAASEVERQPTAIGFWDARHGLLATVDWGTCRSSSYCRAHLLVTKDGGSTWTRVAFPRLYGPLEIAVVPQSRVAFAFSDRSGGSYKPAIVLRTANGGRTWQRLSWRNVSWIAFATPRVGWVVRATRAPFSPALFSTRDGGRTWRRLRPCQAWELYVSLPTGRRGWAMCALGAGAGNQLKRFLSTADGGRSWHVRSTALPLAPNVGRGLSISGYPRGVSFVADGSGWLWHARGALLTTETGGRRWSDVGLTEPETVEALSAVRLDKRRGFVLLRNGRKGGWELVRTRDGGRKWSTVRLWPW
jgi:photosystem II stability/assembly factor-like uncharacterized protein